jgi:hypothetical protein
VARAPARGADPGLAERKKRRARAATDPGAPSPQHRLVRILAVATIVEAFLTASSTSVSRPR